MTQLEKQLPGKAEMDALLSDINQAGLGRGLQFELFRPGQVVGARTTTPSCRSRSRVTGRYHDIGAFAADVANLSRIVTLHNLTIARRARTPTGALAMEATARTYRYLDPTEVDEQRKAAAGEGQAGEPRNDGARCTRPLAVASVVLRAACWPAAAPTRTSCSSGWSSRSARSSRTSQPLSPPKKFDPQPYAALSAVEPFSTQKLTVALKQESAAAEFAAGGRDQPPQGAARGLSAGQHGDGRQRRHAGPAVRAAARWTTCCTRSSVGDYLGQNYGKITQDLRDRRGAARDRAGRGRRMDRAQQRAAASGEGAR